VLAGEAAAAAAQIPELRARGQKLDAGGRMLPLLERVLGWALLELGAVDDAAAAFERGLSEAPKGRSVGFELVALLEGRVLVARAHGHADTAFEAELEAKLAELDVAVRPGARLRSGS
jgi:hypothetical protein